MELFNKLFSCIDVGHRFPSSFFNRITLPMDKIMQLPTDKLGIQDLFDFVDIVSGVDRGRRWRLFLRWVQWSAEWSEKDFIEDWVDGAPSFGQVEFIRRFTDLLNDFKRSMVFVVKFLDGSVCAYVGCF
jgi:hypothetical protein